ncbi:MAG: hypothetical protein ACHQD9_03390 [Chitinophagales bacterium]
MAWPNYGTGYTHYHSIQFSNLEFQLLASYRKPVSKKTSLKVILGPAFSGFDFTKNEMLTLSNNIYFITQAGFRFTLPGKSHFLFLGLDYHLGFLEEYNFSFPSSDASGTYQNTIHSKGSYLALNTDIIFGKEKKSKPKSAMQKNFVM